jgi:hypothetical protein
MREIILYKCSYSNGKSRGKLPCGKLPWKLPWFSAQIEDVPIPIDSNIWAGSYDKKRRSLRISNNFMITRVVSLTVLILGISQIGFYMAGIIQKLWPFFEVVSIWKRLEWGMIKDNDI